MITRKKTVKKLIFLLQRTLLNLLVLPNLITSFLSCWKCEFRMPQSNRSGMLAFSDFKLPTS